MAILKKEDIISKLKNIVGEKTDDETLSFLEDVSDTLNEDKENWKEKYEKNDAEWRKKYRDRFFNPRKNIKNEKIEDDMDDDFDDENNPGEKPKKLTYENLFTKEEEKK